MRIKVKRTTDSAVLPTYGSENAAGCDLYSAHDKVIYPHTTEKIDTGCQFELPDGYFAAIFARSGLATKDGLRPANCVGVCDSDYRGNYIVALHNDSDRVRIIHKGDRIAQMVILPCFQAEFEETGELSDTKRGDGGFGSTGTGRMDSKPSDKEEETVRELEREVIRSFLVRRPAMQTP